MSDAPAVPEAESVPSSPSSPSSLSAPRRLDMNARIQALTGASPGSSPRGSPTPESYPPATAQQVTNQNPNWLSSKLGGTSTSPESGNAGPLHSTNAAEVPSTQTRMGSKMNSIATENAETTNTPVVDSTALKEKLQEMWPSGQMSICRVDFIPSSATDTITVANECMNDWLVRAGVDPIKVETLTCQYPETTVWQVRESAWFGSLTFHVQFIRLWYRACGPPRYEKRYTRGRDEQPHEFPAMGLPEPDRFFYDRAAYDQEKQRYSTLHLKKSLPNSKEERYDAYTFVSLCCLSVFIIVGIIVEIMNWD